MYSKILSEPFVAELTSEVFNSFSEIGASRKNTELIITSSNLLTKNTSNERVNLVQKNNNISNLVNRSSEVQVTTMNTARTQSVATLNSTSSTSAPVAVGDTLRLFRNRANIILTSDLLANDRDPSNSRLSLIGVSNAVNGRVEINGYGNVVFTPNHNYTGVARFNYTIRNTRGLTATTQVNVEVRQPPTMPIGINLTSVHDWSVQMPFIDVFKTARSWFWEGSYTTMTTNLDRDGWVTSANHPTDPNARPGTLLFTDIPNRRPSGQYVVLYDGEGTIKYSNSATKNNALSRPGRDVININPAQGSTVSLQILSTNPNRNNSYIRNIRVVPIGLENNYTNIYGQQTLNTNSARLFNNDFIERIRPFGAVRFMNWMRTNDTVEYNQVHWADRATLNQAQWTQSNGVPVEVMVSLANQINIEPWFTMPHTATDDYVRNFALYVRNNLAPNRKIYVEYTNEAWNSIFPQARWIDDQARAAGKKRMQWYSERTAQMVRIWREVFGTESNRIVGVLATQGSVVFQGREAIEHLRRTGNLGQINAIAIAPYFGAYLGEPEYEGQVQRLSINGLFDELTQGGLVKNSNGTPAAPGGALQQAYGHMQNYATLAQSNNLQLLAYEGGQHLAGVGGVENNNSITNLFIAANRDPRMGEIYQQYFARWNQLNGGLFMHYSDVVTPSKWGSWGVMENLQDVNHPKYASLMQMVQPKT